MIRSKQAKIWKEAFKFWNRVNVDNRKNMACDGDFYWSFGRLPELKENEVLEKALEVANVKSLTKDKTIIKKIFVPNKILNLVV